MKQIILTALVLTMGTISYGKANASEVLATFLIPGLGNPAFVPVTEDPGVDAEVIEEVVHSKKIVIAKEDLKFKWTTLGYGSMTEKVIVQDLAAHTLFNHRNPGEDGPCLRSFRQRQPLIFNTGGTVTSPITNPADANGDITVQIQILNKYTMNREKNICKVNMVEHVSTVIGGIEFSHTYQKDMGHRYIGDCPVK